MATRIDPTQFNAQTLADIEKLTEMVAKAKLNQLTAEDIKITGILVDRAPLHVRDYCKKIYNDMLQRQTV